MNQPLRTLLLPLALTACQVPSDPPIVTITPEFPVTTDNLVATWELPEGAEDAQVTLQWFRDDALQSGLTEATIPAERTVRSQRWSVEVKATLGNRELEVGRAEVLVQNAAPSVSVVINPDPPTSGDDLVAVATVTEPDGDPTQVAYLWKKNGAPTTFTTDRVPASATAQGETWSVIATASDGIADNPSEEASVSIGPSPPIVRNMAFDPNPPIGLLPTTLSYEAFDPDGTDVTVEIGWEINGSAVSDVTGDTLPMRRAFRDDLLAAIVTATDEDGGETTQRLEVTVGNSPPTVDTVVVTPEQPDVTTPITCSATGLADVDGDLVNLVWEWQHNGSTTTLRTETVNPAIQGWAKGDSVQCVAVPSDGSGPGVSLPGEIVVLGNAAPTLASAAINQPADDDDPLTLTLGAASDPDGDNVTFAYRWLANSSLVGTGPTLEQGRYERGQTVRAFVRPIDSEGLSGTEIEATGSFTAVNRPPSILGHTPSVQIPTRAAPFQVDLDLYDPDGDPVSVTWTWTLGGSVVASVIGDTYPTNRMFRGSLLAATAVPSDGEDTGPAYQIGPYTIGNAVPIIQDATFQVDGASTDFPFVDETKTVTCIQTGMTDADGDLLSVEVSWTIDDVEVSTDATLDSSVFSKGDEVTCTLVANDSIGESVPFEVGTFTVQNAPPTIGSLSFTPQSPRTIDTITVNVNNVTDPDDSANPPALSYSWRIGDTEVGTTNQLPSTAFKKGDIVIVFVTATDAEGASTTLDRSVTIINTAPTITDAFITPSFPRTDSAVTIQGTWSDPDTGDTLVPQVTWRKNGTVIAGQTGLTLPGDLLPDLFKKDDVLSASLRISDGSQQSAAFTISPVTVVDAAPTDPVARIEPRWSYPGDRDLRCEVAVASADPDGDIVTYKMLWYRDEVLFNGEGGLPAPTQTIWPGDTLPKGAVQAGETWRCEVTAFSGSGPSATPGGQDNAFAGIAELAFRDLGMGADFGCGRDASGAMRCWGKAGSAETSFPSLTLNRVFVGDLGSCGLDSTGVPRCWGIVPSGTPPTPVIDMDIGTSHACSRTSTNLVQCWGADDQDQASPIDPDSGLNVVARRIAVGGRHSCAIRDDGSIVCWGANDAGQKDAPTEGGPWVDIAAGSDWTCAVSNDNGLTCWGDPTDPVVIGAPTLKRFVDVQAGAVHACAIDVDDKATCWGDPAFVNPIIAPNVAFATVHLGQQSTCGLTLDGDVVCWGRAAKGQLVPSDENLPWVAPGGEHSCAVDQDGAVLCWGDEAGQEYGQTEVPSLANAATQTIVGSDTSCALLDGGSVTCWGRSTFGIRTPPGGVLFDRLEAGVDHACGLTRQSSIQCWGRNDAGQADEPTMGTWIDVSAGNKATCGLEDDGTLSCWGDTATSVITNAPDDTFAYKDVDIDESAGCAIREIGGNVECWGSGAVVTNAPGNSGLRQVAVGRLHACALDGSGTILCWGNSFERRTTPPSGVFSELIDGREHMCAVRTFDGRTICWGPEGRR